MFLRECYIGYYDHKREDNRNKITYNVFDVIKFSNVSTDTTVIMNEQMLNKSSVICLKIPIKQDLRK